MPELHSPSPAGMRIAIVGLGYVGSSVAISVLASGLARELLLVDLDRARAEGEALDLSHGAPFYAAADVRAADLPDVLSCDAIVISAGRGGAPGESRLALLDKNARLARDLGESLRTARGLIVVVSNPVDVLTRIIAETSKLDPSRVFGTGTMLDTARLRQMLGHELRVDPRSVHAQVLGEHGDSEVIAWSSAQLGGCRLRELPGWHRDREDHIAREVRTAAHEIIRRKGATNHAIGLVTARLLGAALHDERRVLTVSRIHTSTDGVALSLPTIVGRDGATDVIMPELSAQEAAALDASRMKLREAHGAAGF